MEPKQRDNQAIIWIEKDLKSELDELPFVRKNTTYNQIVSKLYKNYKDTGKKDGKTTNI